MLWLVLEAAGPSATPATPRYPLFPTATPCFPLLSPCYLPYAAHLMLHLLEPEKITHLCFFAPQPKLPVGPREGEGLIAGV